MLDFESELVVSKGAIFPGEGMGSGEITRVFNGEGFILIIPIVRIIAP